MRVIRASSHPSRRSLGRIAVEGAPSVAVSVHAFGASSWPMLAAASAAKGVAVVESEAPVSSSGNSSLGAASADVVVGALSSWLATAGEAEMLLVVSGVLLLIGEVDRRGGVMVPPAAGSVCSFEMWLPPMLVRAAGSSEPPAPCVFPPDGIADLLRKGANEGAVAAGLAGPKWVVGFVATTSRVFGPAAAALLGLMLSNESLLTLDTVVVEEVAVPLLLKPNDTDAVAVKGLAFARGSPKWCFLVVAEGAVGLLSAGRSSMGGRACKSFVKPSGLSARMLGDDTAELLPTLLLSSLLFL